MKQSTLVLDIDSASVGACVLDFLDTPHISAVTRLPIGTGTTRSPELLIKNLRESLTTLVADYVTQYPQVSQVAVILASPWFAASVRSLTTKSEKPVKVSRASVRTMVDEFRSKNPPSAGRVILEALPITVEVNGYRTRVQNPVHGTTLAVTFYESFTDESLYTMVRDVVHGSYAKADVLWHTMPLAYAETLLRLSDEDHATVLDVGGEVTDVVALSHQRIAYVGSIPIGAKTIARAVGGKKDAPLADALSRLSMFARAELTQKEMQTISATLTEAARDWHTQYRSVLDEAGNTVPLSHRVFVVGERDELPWFTQIISSAESHGQRPVPTIVEHSFLSGLVTYGDKGIFDSSLVLDALFFHMQMSGTTKNDLGSPVLYSVQ